mgnify:CR=1 FL=1
MKTFLLKIIRKLKGSHNEQKKEWGTYGMLGLIFMVLPDIIYILSDEQLIIPEYKIELLNKSKKIINTIENIEENYEPQNNDEDLKTNIEMPPQRDIRDAQPTISVNYRVIKNTEESNIKRDQNY